MPKKKAKAALTFPGPLQRQIRLDVDPASWKGKPAPPRLAALHGRQCSVSMTRVLAAIPICTAPLTGYGFELSQFWAHLRYGPALGAGPGLRLRPEWSDIDSHQKTILSDDFGMGVPWVILTRALRLKRLVPTQFILDGLVSIGSAKVSAAARDKRGQFKSPDFIGIGQDGKLHVLECKGTQSADGIRKALPRGREQKANLLIEPKARRGEALVSALYVPQHEGGSPRCLIVDPEAPENEEVSVISPRPGEIERIAAQWEIAAGLHVLGATFEAASVARGEWTGDARASMAEQEHTWGTRQELGAPLRTRSFVVRFPSPLEEQGERLVGIRAEVGLDARIVEKLMTESVASAVESARVSGEHRSILMMRTPDRAAILTAAGVYSSIEILRRVPTE
ncbi:hypothetical protein ACOQFB_05225 [Anaeromyxobacter sp. Red801]|uniref:hypothetical protein n=1 Tax=Anaeromyxobacter sp. Red801 TaxID=3411632 RepID=UPI003BA1604B